MITRGGKDAAPHAGRQLRTDRQNESRPPPSHQRVRPSSTRIPRLLSPVPPGPLPRGLTVQLYFTQSSQKCEAENFLRMTIVMPCSKHCPIPTMFPAERQPRKPSVPTHLPPRQGDAHATRWLTAGGRSSGQSDPGHRGGDTGQHDSDTRGSAPCPDILHLSE